MKVARFASHLTSSSQDYELSTILREIREGKTSVISSPAAVTDAGGNSLRHATEYAQRLLSAGNKPAFDEIKKSLPGVCFQGVSSEGTREIDTLSGLVICEYDNVDDVYYWLSVIRKNPYVRAAFVSMSGKGLKVIGVTSTIPTPETYHLAWYAFSTYFEEIGDVDDTGARVNQMNVVAYADRFYENINALPLEWNDVDDADFQDAFPMLQSEVESVAIGSLPAEYRDAIADMEWKPNDWGKTQLPCMFTEHEFDGWSSRTNAMGVLRNAENDYTFHCLKCSQSKRFRSQRPRPQKRLEIHPTEQATYKKKLAPPESNQASLQNAITDFLQQLESNRSDTTDIFILKYDTGIGKSYGALANARKFGKKVLSLLFNHDLAAEQTHTAMTLGYNAYRFKGRSYNFEKSELRTIPLQMREQNESLFRTYEVMCPVYDKLEPYHEKRLNPYMLCFSCPLLDACKSEGYWSQFSEIRRVDYLSACIQDILFNPDFWTLLETFLSGSVPFQEPETDEAAAIAAMLGILQDSEETQGIFQPFDFAMIDDYTTARLYCEAHYTLEEISNLKKAWAGTPTGDVLNQVFEAILLLYDPEGTQRSVDILTNLFDSLDDETKETVNTNLTKHADRDEYGDVVQVAPWTALRKGIVSLDTLTPVWHSKDWTLLHQLETLINHCENTTQAPMFIDYDGNITLSIPPQVHPKLRDVLLMSATPDFEATKNAFRRQPVTFTTAEGKPSHWAKGVKGFQYVNARWTTQSIFEYQKDDNDKTVYDDDGKPIIKGLRPKAVEMLRKLTELARADSRKCVFISYKDFMEGKIAESQVVKELHDAFDTVTHYDIATGRNFEGYKIFVTFGYPKTKRNTIKREARKQYAHNPEPLNSDYATTTEQGEVYSSTHGRYTDLRMENVRQQLTTQKLQQANGRARPTRWEYTLTLNFSAEPIPGFTELATPFVDADWENTDSFDLTATIAERKAREVAEQEAIMTGDVEELMQASGVSQRQAYELTKASRIEKREVERTRVKELHQQGLSQRGIEKETGFSRKKIRTLLNEC